MKGDRDLSRKEHDLDYERDDASNETESAVADAKRDTIGWLRGNSYPVAGDWEGEPPKTDADLDKAIAMIQADKAGLPEYSFFGDPNWKIADAQIAILQWAKGT